MHRIRLMLVLTVACGANYALAQTDPPVPAEATAPPEAATAVPTAYARCHDRAQRTLRRHTEFSSFKLAADPEPREIKPRGKFTPRFPVDVNRIVLLRGTAESKKTNAPLDAELWCGYMGERLVAADIVATQK
jgi:hypothetical protein